MPGLRLEAIPPAFARMHLSWVDTTWAKECRSTSRDIRSLQPLAMLNRISQTQLTASTSWHLQRQHMLRHATYFSVSDLFQERNSQTCSNLCLAAVHRVQFCPERSFQGLITHPRNYKYETSKISSQLPKKKLQNRSPRCSSIKNPQETATSPYKPTSRTPNTGSNPKRLGRHWAPDPKCRSPGRGGAH